MSNDFNFVEIVCVDVYTTSRPNACFVAYRPPGTDTASVTYLASLTECIRSYCHIDRVNLVTGDFNCPKIDWSRLTSPNDAIHRPLLDCAIECGFTQVVDFPTRLTHILDVILIDEAQRILTTSERPPLGHSDHSCVEFHLLVDFTSNVSTDSTSYYL